MSFRCWNFEFRLDDCFFLELKQVTKRWNSEVSFICLGSCFFRSQLVWEKCVGWEVRFPSFRKKLFFSSRKKIQMYSLNFLEGIFSALEFPSVIASRRRCFSETKRMWRIEVVLAATAPKDFTIFCKKKVVKEKFKIDFFELFLQFKDFNFELFFQRLF